MVPNPYNPLGFDRYSYVRNNPIKYNDPTGHWPDFADFVVGAALQFTNDMSYGVFFAVTGDSNNIDNNAYQEGRQVGRAISTAAGIVLTVDGTIKSVVGLIGGGGAGAACTALTAGTCAPVEVGVTAVAVAPGVIEAGYGLGILYINN